MTEVTVNDKRSGLLLYLITRVKRFMKRSPEREIGTLRPKMRILRTFQKLLSSSQFAVINNIHSIHSILPFISNTFAPQIILKTGSP